MFTKSLNIQHKTCILTSSTRSLIFEILKENLTGERELGKY